MIRAVLFDLDGTLADTAPDLAFALNRVLEQYGRAPLPLARIRPVASHGTLALLRLGFGLEPGAPGFDEKREALLATYRENIARETRLFPGMDRVLKALEGSGRRWGVVTNKPAHLTGPLMEQLGLAARAATVVSGDTLAESKPHPAPLLHAAREAACEPGECLYVGDAERDIIAGRAAGMRTLAALYGYIADDDNPTAWGADGSIDAPIEILDHLTEATGMASTL